MITAFVPVRIGSKSIPKKNIKNFSGKPLVVWMLEAMQKSKKIDRIILAHDSEEFVQIVSKYRLNKVEFYRRKDENAQDTSSTESVLLEYLQSKKLNEDDMFVLGQATNPFVLARDFDDALKMVLDNSDYDALLTCSRIKRFFWRTNGTPVNYDYNNRPRRQDFDGELIENGAFYINKVANILKHKNRLSGKIAVYEMPEYTALELDEEYDWITGQFLMNKHIKENGLSVKKNIKLVLSDVDGVLTDAGMYYSENGDELKKFSTYDGMGFKLLKKEGIKVGIITGEDVKLNRKRAEKLNLDYQFHGNDTKLETIKDLISDLNISLDEVAYIGDDVNCFDLLSHVGLAGCPANAIEKVKNIPGIKVMNKKGGEGAFREFSEEVLDALEKKPSF